MTSQPLDETPSQPPSPTRVRTTAAPAAPAESADAIRCVGVVHVYGAAGAEVVALRGIDLTVARGETVAVVGASGAGKSTLLWLLAGLIRPTAGNLTVTGHPLGDLSTRELANLRARQVGVLLQNPGRNLLPYGTCLDNVLFAQRPARRRPAVKREPGRALLDPVGLDAQRDRRAGGLSGGEQQRWVWRSRSPMGRPSYSPTSRPASSTPTRPRPSWTRSRPPDATWARPSSWSPTTRRSPPGWTAR